MPKLVGMSGEKVFDRLVGAGEAPWQHRMSIEVGVLNHEIIIPSQDRVQQFQFTSHVLFAVVAVQNDECWTGVCSPQLKQALPDPLISG